MRKELPSATIAAGASQSNVVELTEHLAVGFVMPAAWTAAAITFLASDTASGTFNPVYDDAGSEVSITVAASRTIMLKAANLAGLRFVKLRSGTSATPVNQAAAATIGIVAVPV